MKNHVTFPTHDTLQGTPHLATIAHLEFALRAALVALDVEHPGYFEDDEVPLERTTAEDAYALSIQNQIVSLEAVVRIYRFRVERRSERDF